jgi:hypothetical protein
VQDLLLRSRSASCQQGAWGGDEGAGGHLTGLGRLRLLREAVQLLLASEDNNGQSRVLLEADTELDALEASAHSSDS